MTKSKALLESQITNIQIIVKAITKDIEEKQLQVGFHQLQAWKKRRAILNNTIKKLKKEIALLPQLTVFDNGIK